MKTVKIRRIVEITTLGILIFGLFSQLTNIFYLLILTRIQDLPQALAFAQRLNNNVPYLLRVIKAYLDSAYGGLDMIRALLLGISLFDWLILIYLIVLAIAKEVAPIYQRNYRQLSALTLSSVGANGILLIGVAYASRATSFAMIMRWFHLIGYGGLVIFVLLLVLTNIILVTKLQEIFGRTKDKTGFFHEKKQTVL